MSKDDWKIPNTLQKAVDEATREAAAIDRHLAKKRAESPRKATASDAMALAKHLSGTGFPMLYPAPKATVEALEAIETVYLTGTIPEESSLDPSIAVLPTPEEEDALLARYRFLKEDDVTADWECLDCGRGGIDSFLPERCPHCGSTEPKGPLASEPKRTTIFGENKGKATIEVNGIPLEYDPLKVTVGVDMGEGDNSKGRLSFVDANAITALDLDAVTPQALGFQKAPLWMQRGGGGVDDLTSITPHKLYHTDCSVQSPRYYTVDIAGENIGPVRKCPVCNPGLYLCPNCGAFGQLNKDDLGKVEAFKANTYMCASCEEASPLVVRLDKPTLDPKRVFLNGDEIIVALKSEALKILALGNVKIPLTGGGGSLGQPEKGVSGEGDNSSKWRELHKPYREKTTSEHLITTNGLKLRFHEGRSFDKPLVSVLGYTAQNCDSVEMAVESATNHYAKGGARLGTKRKTLSKRMFQLLAKERAIVESRGIEFYAKTEGGKTAQASTLMSVAYCLEHGAKHMIHTLTPVIPDAPAPKRLTIEDRYKEGTEDWRERRARRRLEKARALHPTPENVDLEAELAALSYPGKRPKRG